MTALLQNGPLLQSDFDFTVFLATRSRPKVERERFAPPIATTLAREYDLETTNQLSFIHGQQATRRETRNAS